jgi:hypothetical protein
VGKINLYNIINYLILHNGGETVPRTIICINTIKSYLIGYNSIFCALNTLPDLLRPIVIRYFVVGSVVGRDRSSWHF